MSRENEMLGATSDHQRINDDPSTSGGADLSPKVREALATLTGHLYKVARENRRMKKAPRAPLPFINKKRSA